MNLYEIYKNTFEYHKNELAVAFYNLLYAWLPTRKVDLLRYKAIEKLVVNWYEFRNEMLGG